MHQLAEVRSRGSGTVQLGSAVLLSGVVEVDVVPVDVHNGCGGLTVIGQLQQVIRIVGEEGKILLQWISFLQYLIKALEPLVLFCGAGVQMDQFRVLALALGQIQCQGVRLGTPGA